MPTDQGRDEHYEEPNHVGEDRARELYQYYRPPKGDNPEIVFLPYADTVLQAHCQLAACRLNVQRAMICLVDKDTQFFLAEATKTIYGSISFPKKGGLVEWTLAQEPHHENDEEIPAYLEVLDLPTDPRWKDRQFIATKPHFRYFCGVPIRTENEVNIGCLFLMDTVVPEIRENISIKHVKLLATCAKNIMVHLQTVREAQEKRRAFHMNMCLADFVKPKDRFRRRVYTRAPKSSSAGQHNPAGDADATRSTHDNKAAQSTPPDGESVIEAERVTPPMTAEAGNPHDSNEDRGRTRETRTRQPAQSPAESSVSPAKQNVTEADHQRTFDRAAYLIRQSLDIGMGGGVCLLDTSAAPGGGDAEQERRRSSSRLRSWSGFADDSPRSPDDGRPAYSRNNTAVTTSPNVGRDYRGGGTRERVVLAAASIEVPDEPPLSYGRADSTFLVTIAPQEMLRLCTKYPRGRLFHLPDHLPTTLYDASGRTGSEILSAKVGHQVLLRRQFPNAKQVIFVPMFHPSLNRWTGCFAYTSSRYRVFSYETDYLHTLSFCNLLRAEIVKIATLFADQQKSDFIGSVSHELRSPLHGILAAIEFLQGTECNSFQKSCLDTADACAHTLLDTITMVLDYQKVKDFKRPGSESTSDSSNSANALNDGTKLAETRPALRNDSDTLLESHRSCNLAAIAEEVVEGTAMAHYSRQDPFRGTTSSTANTPIGLGIRPGLRRVVCSTRPEVELVLEVHAHSTWHFNTQPGAFRRILMNLIDNSLKYTKHGYILATLQVVNELPGSMSAVPGHGSCSIVRLAVQDTGKGISPEYLQSRIFTPFAQENSRTAGSGLGLSMVKGIVTMLKGEINVKSILHTGTLVTVTLPMERTEPTNSVQHSLRHQHTQNLSVLALQQLNYRLQAAIYMPELEMDSFGQTDGARAVHRALMQYMSGWFHLPILQTWDFEVPAQILIVDEVHLYTLLARRPMILDTLSRQSIIILCTNPARQATMATDIKSELVQLLCKPFGPYKLARTVRSALDKLATASSPTQAMQVPSMTAQPTMAMTTPSEPPSASTDRSGYFDDTVGSNQSSPAVSPAWQPLATPDRLPPPSPGSRNHYEPNLARYPRGRAGPKQNAPSLKSRFDDGFPFPTRSGRTSEEANLSFTMSTELQPQLEPESPISPCQSSQPGGKPASWTAQPPRPQLEKREVSLIVPSSARSSLTPDPPSDMPGRKPRVLLVDDNKVNLQLLHTYVKRRGFGADEVKTAEDGAQAYEAFRSLAMMDKAPDIVFMDISMPVMDGNEATRAIRRFEDSQSAGFPKRSFVIALTGNLAASDREEAMYSGCDMFATKPMSLKEIGRILDDWRE